MAEYDDLEYLNLDEEFGDDKKKKWIRKFAVCKFIYKGREIYKFDLWTTRFGNRKIKLIELRNIINNFDKIRPENIRKVKEFFAIVGLVRFVFPKIMIDVPIETDFKSISDILTDNVNLYIKYAKLKGLEFKIELEE